MASRREFLSKMFGSSIAATMVVPAGIGGSLPEEYHGYRLRWTGWRQDSDETVWTGFWLAHLPDPSVCNERAFIFASVPGLYVNFYRAGHVLPRMSREFCTDQTPETVRAHMISNGLSALKQFIDREGYRA